ncbi:hypothetical protein [Metabacillus malikii]|uniref:hypothetical protein n=1 Tax=Metabacillus malikii TaxID=1504265 RepID=UPI0027D863BD|nr:hypothetical protein [Metabacillus malikii]
MKKSLYILGIFLIIIGFVGLINHLSMLNRAIKAEQVMYDTYNPSLILVQLAGTTTPYLTCLIGGGLILAVAVFITEFQKRTEASIQIIDMLNEKRSVVNNQQSESSDTQNKDDQPKSQTTEDANIANPDKGYDGRFYWKG